MVIKVFVATVAGSTADFDSFFNAKEVNEIFSFLGLASPLGFKGSDKSLFNEDSKPSVEDHEDDVADSTEEPAEKHKEEEENEETEEPVTEEEEKEEAVTEEKEEENE
uniref:SH3 domain-binding glutamic acid-rich protein-like isoform X3 n=1 Tax=Geotrypetes seraphini TaxID=260995 RepID=A0A6P8RAA6_GEOSA|nr:SH3 domain-binding glutamic acid-rich protein-like isoform X3 [Geotrypetes seraphini]